MTQPNSKLLNYEINPARFNKRKPKPPLNLSPFFSKMPSTSSKFLSFLLLFLTFFGAPATDSNRRKGICETFVALNGFRCRQFTVPTSDLYLLTMQRISSRNVAIHNETKPVFLFHGIMQGGEIWVMNEPNESLGFILAEAGYDVWIGNARSSSFSLGHLHYSQCQKEYWDWDLDDIATNDVPTMLRFIRRVTEKQILYVGFSQGAMAGFAAFTYSKVSDLVEKAVMLSPIAYLSNIRSTVARMAAASFLDQLDLALGVSRFSLSDELVKQILRMVCDLISLDCQSNFLALIEGPSHCINQSRTGYYKQYELQSTSMRNIVQLAQLVRSGRFCKYDHGIIGNLIRYWAIFPPSYKLHGLPKRLPFLLAYGGNDYLADGEDVMHVSREIPGPVDMLFMPDYSHEDFVLGTCAHNDVYPTVLSFFES
ncbi:triacylglycerol lipase 1-like isoform X1 [Magnolia sinica]|uniref:triacylglycerol lipase 1-like isoform X1 n=1 Tax=Magnolia sinica TaxID=86752 RepID=UPI00265B2EBF|nr:triacylglycerol lipase 1-like isoform X1 [Magnolia sinica]